MTKLENRSIMVCFACQKEINELPYYYALIFKVNGSPTNPQSEVLEEKRLWCKECGK